MLSIDMILFVFDGTYGGHVPCGVTAHGSPGWRLQFDRFEAALAARSFELPRQDFPRGRLNRAALQFRDLKAVKPRGLFRFNLYPQLRFGFLLGAVTPRTTLQNLC